MVSMPSRCSFSSATGPIPHSRRTGQPVQQHAFLVAAHHPDAVGFGQPRSDLGDLLAGPGADGCDQPGHLANLGTQLLAEGFHVLGGRPLEFDGFTEGLVEGQLFEDRDSRADRVEHPAAGHAVDDAARRKHDRRGADKPAGLVHRHRRPGAENPRFVAGTRDHTASAEPADQHRPAAQCGPGQLLDRREERVHVEVQHPSRSHTCRC